MGYRLWERGYRLEVIGYGLWVKGYRLEVIEEGGEWNGSSRIFLY